MFFFQDILFFENQFQTGKTNFSFIHPFHKNLKLFMLFTLRRNFGPYINGFKINGLISSYLSNRKYERRSKRDFRCDLVKYLHPVYSHGNKPMPNFYRILKSPRHQLVSTTVPRGRVTYETCESIKKSVEFGMLSNIYVYSIIS